MDDIAKRNLKNLSAEIIKRREYFVIGFILLFYLVNNLAWLVQNRFPAGPDEHTHLIISSVYGKLLTFDIQGAVPFFPRLATNHWPPLYHVTAAVWGLITGGSYVSSVMVNILYLALLLVSLYLTGLKLFDRQTGLVAAVLVSLYPIVFRYSRFFGPDLALTALVSAGVCSLLYSDFFGRRKGSVLLGVVIGLGMLTKWTCILYLAGPLGYVLWKARKSAPAVNRGKNMAFCFGNAALISSVWYIPFFSIVMKMIRSVAVQTLDFQPGEGDPGLRYGLTEFSVRSSEFLKSVNFTINEEMSLVFFLLLAGVLYLYISRRRNRAVPVLWFGIPYLIMTLFVDGRARHMLPAVPALALVSAAGLGAISSVRTRSRIFFSVLLLGLFQFFYVSYNVSRKDHSLALWSPVGDIYPFYSARTENNAWFYGAPDRRDWKIEGIAESIKDKMSGLPELKIGVISSKREFSFQEPLNYHLARIGRPDARVVPLFSFPEVIEFVLETDKINCMVHISEGSDWPVYGHVKEDLGLLLDDVRATLRDYMGKRDFSLFFKVVYRAPIYEIDDTFVEEALRSVEELLDNKREDFDLVDRIDLPDGYTAYIYRRAEPRIEKGETSLEFINGRAYVTQADNPVTAVYPGMETCFVLNGKEYASSDAVWEVRSSGKGTMEARGTWKGLDGLSQVWKMEVLDGKVVCDVEIESSYACSITDFRLTSAVPEGYGSYSNIISDGEIGRRSSGGVFFGSMPYVGLKGDGRLPELVFHGRGEYLPSFQLGKKAYGRTYVSVTDDHAVIGRGRTPVAGMEVSIYPSGAIGWEEKMEELRNRSVVKSGEVLAFFSNGRAQVWCGRKKLTADLSGLETGFIYGGRKYYSSEARWEVIRAGRSSHRALGEWEGLPGIVQVWDLEVDPEGVECRVGYKGLDPSKMGSIWINMSLSSGYRSYETFEKKGRFSVKLKGGTVAPAVPYIGIKREQGYPGLLFSSGDTDMPVLALGQHAGGSAYVNMTETFPGREASAVMRIGVFSGPVEWGQAMRGIDGKYIIRSGDVKAYFWNGTVRLWYADSEVTNGSDGIRTRFMNGGRAYSSVSSGYWRVRKVSDTELEARGVWRDLPGFAQVWSMKVSPDIFSSEVGYHGKDVRAVGGSGLDAVLSSLYRGYETEKKKGNFSLRLKGIMIDERAPYIGVGGRKGLPGLLFHGDDPERYDLRLGQHAKGSGYVSITSREMGDRGWNRMMIDIRPGGPTALRPLMDKVKKDYVIGSGKVKLFFWEGEAHVWYGDRRVTGKVSGMKTGFVYRGKEYGSLNASKWEVRRLSDRKMQARCSWGDMEGVMQVWNMEVSDGKICCEIGLDPSKDMKLEGFHMDMPLSDRYSRYRTQGARGMFDNVKGGSVIDERVPYAVLEGARGLPGLLFHMENKDDLNVTVGRREDGSGFVSTVYGLRRQPAGQAFMGGICLDIFGDDEDALDDKEEKIKERCVIREGITRLLFHKGRLVMWSGKGRISSMEEGIRTVFKYRDREYISSEADWEVRKVSPSRLEARGCWQGFEGVVEHLGIELKGRRLLVDVYIENGCDIYVDEFRVDAVINGRYDSYRDMRGRHKFLQGRSDKVFVEAVPYAGIDRSGHLAGLFFRGNENGFSDIGVGQYITGSRYVEMLRRWIWLPAGMNPIGLAEVALYSDDEDGYLGALEDMDGRSVIREGSLGSFFSAGRLRAWYLGNRALEEIATVESGFICSGRRYFSATAQWEVSRPSQKILEWRGRWKSLPGITQVWRAELTEKGMRCSTGFEGRSSGGIEDFWMKTSLSGAYRRYRTLSRQGVIPASGDAVIDETVPYAGLEGDKGYPWLLFHAPEGMGQELSIGHESPRRGYVTVSNKRIDPGDGYTAAADMHMDLFSDDPEGWMVRMEETGDKYVIRKGKVIFFFSRGCGQIWYGRERVTADLPGMEAGIIIGEKKYSSYDAKWEVTRLSGSRLEARGAWEVLPGIEQVWDMEVTEKGLRCALGVECGRDETIDQFWLKTAVSGRYGSYETLSGKGRFRPSSIPDEVVAEALPYAGIRRKGELPGLVFCVPGCDVPYFRVGTYGSGSRYVSVSEDSVAAGRGKTGIIDLDISVYGGDVRAWKKMMDSVEERCVAVSGRSKVFMSCGRVQLWYGKQRITAGLPGMETGFRYKGWVYPSTLAEWKVEKTAPGRLEARGVWDGLPGITQVWTLEALKQGYESSVGLDVEGDVDVDEFWIDTSVNNAYGKYVTMRGKGLLGDHPEGSIIADAVPYVSMGRSGRLPALLFFSGEEDVPNFRLGRQDNGPGCAILAKDQVTVPLPAGALGSLRIGVYPRSTRAWLSGMGDVERMHVIRSGPVNAFFSNGRLQLRYGGQDLTDGISGIETGFKKGRRGYASSYAVWHVEKISEKMLVARGEWSGSGDIAQVWDVEIMDESVRCSVILECERDMILGDFWMTTTMSGKYGSYRTPLKSGLLPDAREEMVIADGLMCAALDEVDILPSVLFVSGKESADLFRLGRFGHGPAYVTLFKDEPFKIRRGSNPVCGQDIRLFPTGREGLVEGIRQVSR